MDIIGDGLKNLREVIPSDYFKILNNPTLFRDRILALFKEKD